MSIIKPQSIHTQYGIKPLEGIKLIKLEKSSRKHSKYAITIQYKDQTRKVHYGDKRYQQFHDRTSLHLYDDLNHQDSKRRHNYLARSSKILNSSGDLTCNDPFSPNRYSIITLW